MHTIKNFFIFTILSFLFFVLGFTIPFTGIFLIPLSSVSVVLLFIKSGILSGLLGAAITSAAIYKFTSTGGVFSFIFILLVILNSLFLYSGIKRERDCWRIVMDSCIAVSFTSVAVILSFFIRGFQVSWIFGKIAAGLPKDISIVFLDIITRNTYSIAVIFITVMVTLSYLFLSAVSDRFNVKIKKLPSFEKWRLPEKFIFVFILSILFYVVFKHIKNAVFFQISENIINIIFFLYFVGGLSIGKYFFNKSKIMLMISYFIFFLYSPSAVFLGVSDVWLDFRKKKEEKKDEGYLKAGY